MALNYDLEFLEALNPEQTFFDHLNAFVAVAERRTEWKPGASLRILLAGYVGAGNVGSDMRSIETIRQLRHLLGAGNVSLTTILNGPYLPAGLSLQSKTAAIRGYAPKEIVELAQVHDAVVACEGSMLKSSFSNVLSGIMVGALAVSSNTGRLAVGYGAEVASMESMLEDFVRKWLPPSLLLCRNEKSLGVAKTLNLRAELGAETAWTCHAASDDHVRSQLNAWGYEAPFLAVCPVNPFWWPVRPNPQMDRKMKFGNAARAVRYDGIFFHTYDEVRAQRYADYIAGMAQAVNVISRERGLEPMIVAMEAIDVSACNDLVKLLDRPAKIVVGREHTIGLMVALLRSASLVISSRFHALVAAAPSCKPLIGVATDERITNLLSSHDTRDSVIEAYESDLAARIISAVRGVNPDEFRVAMQKMVSAEVVGCGHMAIKFADEVEKIIPNFPLPQRARTWQAYLPPLPGPIQELLTA